MILFGRSGEKCGRISLIRLALSGYPMFTKCFERVRAAVLMTASYTVIRRHVQPEENFPSIRVAHMLLIYHFNFISESKLKKGKLWNSNKSSMARVMRSLDKKIPKTNKTESPKNRDFTQFWETSFGFRVLLQLLNSFADVAQVCRHSKFLMGLRVLSSFPIFTRNEKHYSRDKLVAITYFQKLYFTD